MNDDNQPLEMIEDPELSPDFTNHPVDPQPQDGKVLAEHAIVVQDSTQESEYSGKGFRQELAAELDALIERMKLRRPDYTPPPFSPRGMVRLMKESLEKFSPETGMAMLDRLRSTIRDDFLDLDTWKGIWYVVNYSLQSQQEFLRRRLNGDYETDDWGLDLEFLELVKPFFNFLYEKYWRVTTTGMEHLPLEDKALLVCNHSGQLPWDGAMVGTAVYNEHPAQRIVRTLYATWFPTLPFVSMTLTKLGQVLANEENGIRLLKQNHLVAVFPEGYKGVGKLYKDRYRLARFGRGGFVRMALRTGAPMIPVSIVGAEETYISLAKSPLAARLIGFPYFPISPTWPWLGPLGFIPIPTKWYIDFGEPIFTDSYGPDAANNLLLVSQLSDQVRNIIQKMIYQRLEMRQSILFG